MTRATGVGPVLLLIAEPGTSFEAWRPMRHDDGMRLDFMCAVERIPPGSVKAEIRRHRLHVPLSSALTRLLCRRRYENTYELLLHTRAYADHEWKNAKPWNVPSGAKIPPGASRTYGVRMVLAPNLRAVEPTLISEGVPVATPMPSPVIHTDMTDATLLIRTRGGAPDAAAVSVSVEPTTALSVVALRRAGGVGAPETLTVVDARAPVEDPSIYASAPVPFSRLRFALRPLRPPDDGRVRVTLRGGGRTLVVHLYVARPARELVRALGRHGATRGWMPPGRGDPWHRGGAFFGWDAARDRPVLSEHRVYMSGLSDEAGAAAGVAMAAKQLGAPDLGEISLLEEYVHATLYQGNASSRGHFLQGSDDTVRLSMLYWNDELNDATSTRGAAATAAAPELARICRGCWPKKCSWMDCWSEEHSLESWRAYNYPHVTLVYWALYRAGRHHAPSLLRRADWRWYLRRAHATAVAMWSRGGDPWTKKVGGGVGTTQWGVMVGSVFELLLVDLWREGWDELASELQLITEKRMATWLKMPFPYGSEFAWDSTGHEEISTWMLRFGRTTEARQTFDAVSAYASYSPHWAYCGAARRWWDFTINGANARGNERVMHHYAAALNSARSHVAATCVAATWQVPTS